MREVDPLKRAHDKRLLHGARFRALPLNVRCPARCAFCYDARVSQLLPQVRTALLPPYDERQFDLFRQTHARALAWEAETGRAPLYAILPTFDLVDGQVFHFPTCDVFSAGLTHAQIEEMIQMRRGDVALLYSVGLELDLDFIAHLTATYPETFRLHLSIVTFDREIRRGLMSPKIDLDVLREVCGVVRGATFFFILFDEDQLVADLEELRSLTTADSGGVFVHKLYADRLAPERVERLARRAHGRREAAVEALARMPLGGRSLMLSLGADIHAFARRAEICSLVAATTGEADEVIFCSPGAFKVIDDFCARSDNLVIALESAFGGNTDLVQGTRASEVIERIEGLLDEGRPLRRVFLPDAMFWIEGRYDIEGQEVDRVRQAFPQLEVELLKVPPELIFSVVDLGDGLSFFNSPRRAAFESPW